MAYNDWSSDDWTGGLIDKAIDNAIPDNSSRDCSNVVSRYVGLLQKRPGWNKLNSTPLGGEIQGMYPFYYGAITPTRRLMVAANGKLSYWDAATAAFVDVATGLNTSAQMSMTSFADHLIYCNGVDAPRDWDGTTDIALANAPPKAMFFEIYASKVWTVDADYPSILRWTNNNSRIDWSGVNLWKVKEGDGDGITCAKSHSGDLTIFKRYSTHVMTGTTFDVTINPFRLNEIDPHIGCVGRFAAAVDGPLVYFVSDVGLCCFDKTQITNLTNLRIPKFWESIDKTYITRSAVAVDQLGLVWFSLPLNNSATNNVVLVYDPTTGAFWPWTARLACFAMYDDGSTKIFFGGGTGVDTGYALQLNTGTSDAGSAISAYWTSEYYTADTPERNKKIKKIFVTDSEDTSNVFAITVSRTTASRGSYTAPTLKKTTGKLREFKLSGQKRCLEISYRLSHDALGAAEIRRVLMPFSVKNKPGV